MTWAGVLNAVYVYLQDEGGFYGGVVAGVMTLGGGWLAYSAGMVQAASTKEAADREVAAIKEQMAQELEIMTDRDRRATIGLISGLAIETSRLRLLLIECVESLRRRTSGTYQGALDWEMARTYLVEPDRSLRAGLAGDAAVPPELSTPTGQLYSRLDQLIALISVRAKYGDLTQGDLRDALQRALDAANSLADAFAEYHRNATNTSD